VRVAERDPYGPDPEPPLPPSVAELRARWPSLASEALGEQRRVLDSVVEWRWADPQPSLEPLFTERLWGRRSRWLKQAPRRPSQTAGRVGLDDAGRLLSIGESEVYVYAPQFVQGYRLHDDETLLCVERWTVADGRFASKVEVEDGPSWQLTRYDYDEAGRLVLIDEHFWSDGDNVMAMHGHMRSHVAYDPDGELSEIVRHRLHDDTTHVDFRATPRSARQQRDELVELIRAGVLAALRDLPDGSTVRAVCLFYETFGLTPPIVVVDRTGRLDGALEELAIDDLNPAEWDVPEHDRIDVATKVAWPGGGVLETDRGPKVIHDVVRAVARSLDPEVVAAALGAGSPPPVYALDSEWAHLRAHLGDTFGTRIAQKLLSDT